MESAIENERRQMVFCVVCMERQTVSHVQEFSRLLSRIHRARHADEPHLPAAVDSHAGVEWRGIDVA